MKSTFIISGGLKRERILKKKPYFVVTATKFSDVLISFPENKKAVPVGFETAS
jgi:hypothetical protein